MPRRTTALRRPDLPVLADLALTPREQEVWLLMAGVCGDAEVTERLSLDSLTVRAHLSNVLDKPGVASRAEAAALA